MQRRWKRAVEANRVLQEENAHLGQQRDMEQLRAQNTEEHIHSLEEEIARLSKLNAKSKSKIEEMGKELKRLRMRDLRAPEQGARAVQKAVDKAVVQERSQSHTIKLKEKGVIPDAVRAMIRDLAQAGAKQDAIMKILKIVAEHINLDIEGSFSPRAVGRIILEGGVAAKMQVASMMAGAEGELTSILET